MNNIKKCCTKEPDLSIKKEIVEFVKAKQLDVENKKSVFRITDEETITIKVVYHICYKDTDENIESDIQHSIATLNKDFNKQASNFDNGKDVYSYNIPDIQLISYHTYIPYKKPKPYIRYTREIRRNRRLYRETIRKNRQIRRHNYGIRRHNFRTRRTNRRYRFLNRRIQRRNRPLQNRINYYKKLQTYTDLYKNYVSRAGSCNIEFIYDKKIVKPTYSTSSTNIEYINTQLKIQHSPIVQGDEKKLHIWISDLQSGLLGYAQFPWDYKNSPTTDGIVLTKYTFTQKRLYNNYNLGKTLTHEVGHWLGLYHTFQQSYKGQVGGVDTNKDGILNYGERTGDLVEDTPQQLSPTTGNSYSNNLNWPSSVINKKRYYHMFMNFMDYSYDINLFMLTKEQCEKVRIFMNIYREDFHVV